MPDTPAILTLEFDRKAHPLVVKLQGRLVSGVGDILYDQVKPLLPDHQRIVLDLGELARMDSMGLGTLVRLYVAARSAGCTLELHNLSKQIHMLLGTAHLLTAFSIAGQHGLKW